ncbi:MAG TPA: monovalent cation/H(+) antiporter subunit G [Solirubrobacteraceae bacterium]|nr:monovalent cation/H(+) antiporter subunit G [Solirubrobacteraceae bacterium]
MREALTIVLCALGLVFTLSGAVGILRMPDVYCRIQCSSKTITMGALPVLLGLVVAEGPFTAYGGRVLVVTVLLLIVNPAASHALARAAYKDGVPMWSGAVIDEPEQKTRRARRGRRPTRA